MKHQIIDYHIPAAICDNLYGYEINLVKHWVSIKPGSCFTSTADNTIFVLNPGQLNKNNGPDIKNAALVIDGVFVQGDIECHIKNCGWWEHKHHLNRAYDQVILHVVAQYLNVKNELKCPTIILQKDEFHNSSCLLTPGNLSKNSNLIVYNFAHKKWQYLISQFNSVKQSDILNKLISLAMDIIGKSGNEKLMMGLLAEIPKSRLLELPVPEIVHALDRAAVHQNIQWKTGGYRPAHHPGKRLALAVAVIKWMHKTDDLSNIPMSATIQSFHSELKEYGGAGIRSELLGNVLIPWFAFNAINAKQMNHYQFWLNAWFKIQLPDSYGKYVRLFGNVFKTAELKNFHILQGLKMIDKIFCEPKQCGICPLKETYGNFN